MAELTITFSTRANGKLPIMQANKYRTIQATIGAASVEVDNSAADGVALGTDGLARLSAGAECWVAFDTAPTALAGEGWLMGAGEVLELETEPGKKFAVIEV